MAKGRFRHRAVCALPTPVQSNQIVICLQRKLPNCIEDTKLTQFLKILMRCVAWCKTARNRFLLTSGPQTVEDLIYNAS